MLDKFSWGDVKRVNPEQPAAPLVRICKENYALGGAANVANNLSALGAQTFLYGILGRDGAGNKIKKICDKKRINLKFFYCQEPTIVKQRIMAHGQQITRLDFGERKKMKMKKEIQETILKNLEKEIQEFDFIILSDYDKGFFEEDFSRKIIELANLNNKKTLVDPKPCNLNFFKKCTVISPNKHEAEKMSEIEYSNGKETLLKIGKILGEKINSKYIIITCGEDGMFSYDVENEDSFFVGTEAREVADVTGAGDTFAATLTLGLACDLKIHDAAQLANYAAGIVVEKIGTAVPLINEIKKALEDEKENFIKG